MKIHKWEEIIKFFMSNDEQETELWDYITGLRGPDNDAHTWKMMITCIIRGQCAEAYGIETTRSFLTHQNDDDIINALNKEEVFLSNHWFNHSIFALDNLAIYYNNKMKNTRINDLLCSLSYNLDNRYITSERINIVIIVREIIEELYKEE